MVSWTPILPLHCKVLPLVKTTFLKIKMVIQLCFFDKYVIVIIKRDHKSDPVFAYLVLGNLWWMHLNRYITISVQQIFPLCEKPFHPRQKGFSQRGKICPFVSGWRPFTQFQGVQKYALIGWTWFLLEQWPTCIRSQWLTIRRSAVSRVCCRYVRFILCVWCQ